LKFETCLWQRNKTDFELRIRHHVAKDWIKRVLKNPMDKGNKILVADSHEIADYNDQHPNQPLTIIDERIMKINDWIEVHQLSNDFLMPLYQREATRLRENGLLDRVTKKWFDILKVRPRPLENDPVVLTWDHVGVAFKICGAFLLLALIVFVFEVLFIKRLKLMLLQKFIDRYF